jgi:hypothetical protein
MGALVFAGLVAILASAFFYRKWDIKGPGGFEVAVEAAVRAAAALQVAATTAIPRIAASDETKHLINNPQAMTELLTETALSAAKSKLRWRRLRPVVDVPSATELNVLIDKKAEELLARYPRPSNTPTSPGDQS